MTLKYGWARLGSFRSSLVALGVVVAVLGCFIHREAHGQTSGLAAAYAFSEGSGTTTADASGNTNTGTLSGSTWTASGKFGNALVFDGAASRVTVADSTSIRSPSTAISIGAWVYSNGTPQSWASIVHKVHATNYVSYGFGQNSSNLRRLSGYLQVNGVRYTTPMTTALADLTWYYVVLSWQSGQAVKLTVYNANGSVFETRSTTQLPSGSITYDTRPLHIGENEVADTWKGTIDEVRIYNRVLTSTEIQADMTTAIGGGSSGGDTSPPTAPTNLTATAPGSTQINLSWTASTDNVGVAGYFVERCQSGTCTNFVQVASPTGTTYSDTGLQANTTYRYRVRARDAANNLSPYSSILNAATQTSSPPPAGGTAAAYAFSEGNGATTADASGNTNTGTLSGAAWTAAGKFGNALAFNGTSSRVTVADSTSIRSPASAISIGAWVYPDGTSQSWASIVHKVHATNYVSYGFGQYSSNVRRLSGYLQVNGVRYTTPLATALTDLTWYYVVLSWQSGQAVTLTIYNANGSVFNAKSTTQLPSGSITYDASPLYIGENEVADTWKGTIDEVRIYNRVLTSTEIQADMTTAIGGGSSSDTTPPTTPTNLAATAASSSQINLSWTASTDNVGVTGYYVERCQGGTCTNFVQVATPTGTTHSDTGLTASTTYRYRVRARDAANNLSAYSNIASATTQASSPPPPGGTAALYYFDEGTGTTTADASGNANTGTLLGTTWTTAGKFGSALSFNGTSSRVTVADSASIRSPATAISVGAWVYSNGTSQSWASIVHKVHATNYVSYGFGQNSSNVRRFSGYLQVNGTRYTTPMTTALTDLTWFYVVLSWQSGQAVTLTVYNADGSVRETRSTTQAPSGSITYDTSPLYIGENEVGDTWKGTIDETRIYGRVLSSSEIQADMKVSNSTASQFGQWDAPATWPLVAVNMTLLPNGRVLVWDGQSYGTDARVWNPSTGAFTSVTSDDNLFCSGQSLLRDGRTLVAGGHTTAHLGIIDTNIFNHTTQTWSSAPPMEFPRWYPTTTTLPDGRVLVTSGEIGCNAMPPDGSFRPECVADIPEVYNPATNSWTQLSGASLAIPYYPHMFVLPDGKVLNTSTAEGPVPARVLDVTTQTWTVASPTVVDGGSAAMFLPGKVIKSGTSTNPNNPSVATSANTYVLDVTQSSPAWRQVESMAYPRAYHYLTLLPDGTVLATGGSRVTDVYNLGAAVLPAEVWSPVTEQWTTLAGTIKPRVYHSTTLLLPDGRVLTAGGGRYGVDQLSAEIYSPPYLFKGPRPTITSAPSTLQYGSSFSVGTPDGSSIGTVSLLRLGAATHAFNFDQRFLKLTFQQVGGGLSVQAPANANLAPPGYYMLFIVNTNGVPSVASMVRFP